VFALRDYKPTDIDEIFAIDQQCFEPGIAYSREELQFYMKRKGAFTLVAETADGDGKSRIAGFTVVEFHAKGFGHVITIDVLEQFRRSGLGTILMQAGEDQVLAKKGRLMILEVAVNNLAAIKFYKRHGYIVVKTIPRYYNNELDALLMTKKLIATVGKK
jgi:[ribosomal protein S18]-alanine N-acetyltransferase